MHEHEEHDHGKKSTAEIVREREAKRINDMIIKKAQDQAQKDKEAAERASRRNSYVGRRFSVMGGGRRASSAGAGVLGGAPGAAPGEPRRGSIMGMGGGGRKKSTFLGGLFSGDDKKKTARFSEAASETQLFDSTPATSDGASSGAAGGAEAKSKAAGSSYQSAGGMAKMPTLIGSAPIQAVRTHSVPHTQCPSHSPLHACTLLTVACALCVWCAGAHEAHRAPRQGRAGDRGAAKGDAAAHGSLGGGGRLELRRGVPDAHARVRRALTRTPRRLAAGQLQGRQLTHAGGRPWARLARDGRVSRAV